MSVPSIRILVVEDEPSHAAAIERSLEAMEGAVLKVTGTLRGYLDESATSPPDLVLLDLNLPDGSALEVLPDPEGTRPFPLVLMTSYGSEETAVQAMKSGAFDYLVKSPETFADLPRTLARLLREWALLTDRKRIARDLQASERKYRSLAENINDFIIRYERDGRHAYLNPAALAMLGVRAEDVLGKTHAECGCSDAICRFWEETLARVVSEGRPCPFEFEFVGPAGPVTHDCRLTPEFDAEGRVSSILGVSRDITDRKKAEAERRQLEAQVQQAQKLESLGGLASGVAHDMNNVLGAILGLASASLPSQAPGTAARQAFETIILAAERGGKLVKGLLTFARQSPAEARVLDLNALLREEVHLLEHTALSGIDLELDLADDLRPVRGDASALAHAFMNLCLNAVDAMPEGGTLTLQTCNGDPGWVEALVADSGVGMTAEVMARATDPFFTTKAQGKGTGLGLPMAYSIVKAHQGQLELQSEPGRGTWVRLRFPACPEPAPPAAVQDPAPAAGPLRVLLVDDDDLVQCSVTMLLEVLGHQALVASSGEEALAKIAEGCRPDAVVLDMNMPGLGGAGTLPRLHELCPGLPVLLATGRADQGALDLVAAHPGVRLLSKPFTLEELREGLRPLLDDPAQPQDGRR